MRIVLGRSRFLNQSSSETACYAIFLLQGRGDTEQILQGVDGAAAQIGRDFMNQMRNNTFFHKGENLGI